jgi:hypothetical protein
MTTPAVGLIDVSSHPAHGSAEPVDHNSRFASTGRGVQRAPTAKQPDAVGRLNLGSSGTNEQLRSLVDALDVKDRFSGDSDMTDQADKHWADTDDTMQAPPSEDPKTAVVASNTTTVVGNELAWSLDTDEIQPKRHGRNVSAALIALLVAVTASLTWFAATYFAHRPSNPVNSPSVSTPAPVTVTVTPTPPTPTAGQDDEFWRLFKQTDPAENNRAWAVRIAHSVCPEMEGLHLAGYQVADQIANDYAIPLDVAVAIEGNAVQVYCPQLLGH